MSMCVPGSIGGLRMRSKPWLPSSSRVWMCHLNSASPSWTCARCFTQRQWSCQLCSMLRRDAITMSHQLHISSCSAATHSCSRASVTSCVRQRADMRRASMTSQPHCALALQLMCCNMMLTDVCCFADHIARTMLLHITFFSHHAQAGLDKLEFTAQQVELMRQELHALKPVLEKTVGANRRPFSCVPCYFCGMQSYDISEQAPVPKQAGVKCQTLTKPTLPRRLWPELSPAVWSASTAS
eukprot:349632-Chlamydomonas_euryale.AAC.17